MADPKNADDAQEKPQDEWEERFAALEEKAKAIRDRAELPEVPEWEYKRPEHVRKSLEPERGGLGDRHMSYGLAIAYTLVGALFGPWLVGWLIDRQFNTGQSAQAIAVMIGMVSGLLIVVLMVLRMNKDG